MIAMRPFCMVSVVFEAGIYGDSFYLQSGASVDLYLISVGIEPWMTVYMKDGFSIGIAMYLNIEALKLCINACAPPPLAAVHSSHAPIVYIRVRTAPSCISTLFPHAQPRSCKPNEPALPPVASSDSPPHIAARCSDRRSERRTARLLA